MDIPYYLTPNQKEEYTFGVFDIFGDVPVPEKTPTTIWGDLSSSVSSAGDWVWDSAKGAWVSTKETLASVGSAIGETVESGFSLLGKGIDWWLSRVAFILGGLLILVWVLGKSGGFDAIAKGSAAFLSARGGK